LITHLENIGDNMATIDIPNDILFPPSDDDEMSERDRILSDYFTQLRQTLIEIESKLP